MGKTSSRINQSSIKHYLSPWPNVPINSDQNQNHLRPGQGQSLLWVLYFREPCMSQAQKFMQYKTCGPAVSGDPARVTLNICSCDLYHLGHKEMDACPTSPAL